MTMISPNPLASTLHFGEESFSETDMERLLSQTLPQLETVVADLFKRNTTSGHRQCLSIVRFLSNRFEGEELAECVVGENTVCDLFSVLVKQPMDHRTLREIEDFANRRDEADFEDFRNLLRPKGRPKDKRVGLSHTMSMPRAKKAKEDEKERPHRTKKERRYGIEFEIPAFKRKPAPDEEPDTQPPEETPKSKVVSAVPSRKQSVSAQSEGKDAKLEKVQVLVVGEDGTMKAGGRLMDRSQTLFVRVHGGEGKGWKRRRPTAKEKARIAARIFAGLGQISTSDPTSPIIKGFTPFSVLFDASDEICLVLEKLPTRTKMEKSKGEDDEEDEGEEHSLEMELLSGGEQPTSDDLLRWTDPARFEKDRVNRHDLFSCLAYSAALVLYEIQTEDLPFSFTGTPGARRYQHSGVQLLMDGIEDTEMRNVISRILKAGWEERMRLCELVGFVCSREEWRGRKEGICLSRVFADSPCLRQIEDLLGEDSKELLHTPQTRPGRSLKDAIKKLPKEQQKGINIRILSKCQHSRDSEQADVVIVTLPTDTVLPVPLTLPPSTHSSPSRRDQSTPRGPSKSPEKSDDSQTSPKPALPAASSDSDCAISLVSTPSLPSSTHHLLFVIAESDTEGEKHTHCFARCVGEEGWQRVSREYSEDVSEQVVKRLCEKSGKGGLRVVEVGYVKGSVEEEKRAKIAMSSEEESGKD
ncbi:hypothetical protein BLNAU_7279 [Blattamonas nauphoetae]|uniref:Uncharacterized protein n=1 Tax=Blattamonas nauphoetae TaxID=2049346 RepID=A0ABQ9Y2A6_9EUKA|nr:hypothetical protein BLNAU_7279 [Blattamonas nauphoetae]